MQTKRTMKSGIPYIVLGTLYAYLLYLSWTPESLQLMFASEYFLPEVCPLFMDLPHINIHNSTPIDSRMHANSVSEWILFQNNRYRDLIFLPFIPCISYWTSDALAKCQSHLTCLPGAIYTHFQSDDLDAQSICPDTWHNMCKCSKSAPTIWGVPLWMLSDPIARAV